MKNEFNKYGKRLSNEEYVYKVTELYKDIPSSPKKKQETEIRKAELNLQINNRLGKDFPQDKRDEMWAAAERLEKKRASVGFLVSAFAKGHGNPMLGVFQIAFNEFSAVLGDEDLVQFLGGENDKSLMKHLLKNKHTPKL
jgi:hypothetical protein